MIKWIKSLFGTSPDEVDNDDWGSPSFEPTAEHPIRYVYRDKHGNTYETDKAPSPSELVEGFVR